MYKIHPRPGAGRTIPGAHTRMGIVYIPTSQSAKTLLYMRRRVEDLKGQCLSSGGNISPRLKATLVIPKEKQDPKELNDF